MFTYSAPYARMRALKGRFLDQAKKESMLQSPDITSFISVLSQTDYWDQVQNLTDPQQIEHGLRQNLISCYIKILSFLSGKPAQFIAMLLQRFELINLKSIVRAIINQSNPVETSSPFIFSLGRYHTIPIEKALEVKDLESLIKLLKHTPFGRSLETGHQQYEAEKSLMALEIALDLGYYSALQKAFDSLNMFDKGSASKLLSIKYDVSNLVWMLRFKEYHNFTPEQIYQYIIPKGWKTKGQNFWKMMESVDIIEGIKNNAIQPYDRILAPNASTDVSSIIGVELALLIYLYGQSMKAMQGFPLRISSFMGFFIMKEMEVKDIMTILYGKSLDLSQDRIKSHLITFS
jgi:ATP synthase A1 C subunit